LIFYGRSEIKVLANEWHIKRIIIVCNSSQSTVMPNKMSQVAWDTSLQVFFTGAGMGQYKQQTPAWTEEDTCSF
jgi:hypothetical protein